MIIDSVKTFNNNSSVFNRIYQRFYVQGERKIDIAASSHWKEFSRKFSVTNENGEFRLKGYGFGGQESGVGINNIFTLIGNIFQLVNLNNNTLLGDLRHAKKIVGSMGLSFSQDAFRQTCSLNLIAKYIGDRQKIKNILVIGDGPGILSALMHSYFPGARITLVDLGSVLFFQSYQLSKAFPETPQCIADEDAPIENGFIFCPADSLDYVTTVEFDLAINIASMQEFDPKVIANYFSLIRERKTKIFYCCNRLEKKLVGGEVTRFMDYPWENADEHLIDEFCPWHQWFMGLSSTPRVRFLGISVPFMHRYDGPHWHRLTRLAEKNN